MADAALAPSRTATNVSRIDRSSARGPVNPVRPVNAAESFRHNLGEAGSSNNVTSLNAVQPTGPGLLSTGVQMVLAETRTQEAGATFIPPSNVERALNSYQETQTKVRETIRDNLASSGGLAQSTEQRDTPLQQTALGAPVGASTV